MNLLGRSFDFQTKDSGQCIPFVKIAHRAMLGSGIECTADLRAVRGGVRYCCARRGRH